MMIKMNSLMIQMIKL